jgi:hypothetical protein
MSGAPQDQSGQTPESTDTDTTSLYGDTPGDEAPEPDLTEPDPNDPDLRSAGDDPLPDEQAADPNSTPQGPALS